MTTKNRDEEICDIYKRNDDVSMGDIASSDKFDISRQRVHQILKSNGIDTSGRSDSPKYDKSYIRTKIKEFYHEEGYVPTCRDWIVNDYDPSVTTVFNRYGSWNEALKDANLPANIPGKDKKYSREELIDVLTKIHSETNGRLTQSKYQENADQDEHPHFQTIINEFGTWTEAVSVIFKKTG